jgi:predicted dienelactone hydrolase
VLPDTEKGIAPSHSDLAYDISYTLDHFRMLGSDQTSVFYGRIGKKNCAMGHSMGGGSSALAVSYNLNISALATFAMYNTNPSSSSAAKFIQVPALVFSGSNDCITPPEEHQIPFFENLATPEKHYIEITGGSHCQMAAYNKLCRFGEKTCRPVPEIDLSFQHKIIFDYLIPWLDYHLKNNTDSGDTFNSLITGDQRVKTLSYK